MENATKALLMAGGVLIAIIILSVLVITLHHTGNVSKGYDQTVQTEEITTFNSNFTKYLGQNFTIHQAITITNFANSNGVDVIGKYTIKINGYDSNGYINSITISKLI